MSRDARIPIPSPLPPSTISRCPTIRSPSLASTISRAASLDNLMLASASMMMMPSAMLSSASNAALLPNSISPRSRHSLSARLKCGMPPSARNRDR